MGGYLIVKACICAARMPAWWCACRAKRAKRLWRATTPRPTPWLKSAFHPPNIGHELLTPMNSWSMAQLAGSAPTFPAAGRSRQGDAGSRTRITQALLDDVVALTRDDGEQLEDEKDCDPVQTARAVTRLLRSRVPGKAAAPSPSSAASDLPRVAADPRRVRQALLKIADNALDSPSRGLVDIRLDTDPEDAHGHAVCALSPFPTPAMGSRRKLTKLLFEPFSMGDSLLYPQGTGRGPGPGGGQAHCRTGPGRDRL